MVKAILRRRKALRKNLHSFIACPTVKMDKSSACLKINFSVILSSFNYLKVSSYFSGVVNRHKH